MISSLDALHEDMYFAGSDYFKNYGVQTADVMLDAPGLILPKIHQGTGKPGLSGCAFGAAKRETMHLQERRSAV